MFSFLKNLLKYLFAVLTGHMPTASIVTDFYGYRAMVLHLDPYRALGPALKTMGIDWPITNSSTHPPTAYLLTAPVAFLPWPIATAIWGWLMFAAVIVSLRLYGLRWRWVLLITPILCLWSPFVYSLGQLTPIWLLGSALAYHNREKPLTAGAWIAFASLPKYFPALLLIPFLMRRKWSVLISFAAVWIVCLGLVVAIDPGTIQRYIEINQTTSVETIALSGNGALLPNLDRMFGHSGLLIGIIFLAYIGWNGREDWFTWEFLGVALLPIAWIYSLLPLLPGILRRKNLLVLMPLAISFVMPQFGPTSVSPLLLVIIGYGFVLATDALLARRTNSLVSTFDESLSGVSDK